MTYHIFCHFVFIGPEYITLSVKFSKKKRRCKKNSSFSHESVAQWYSGVLQIHRMLVQAQPVLFNFLGQGVLKVKLSTFENFTLYLRNRQGGNLRAIESCVCSIRSIERNMMSNLRTVQ
jgi:hypothetical protein